MLSKIMVSWLTASYKSNSLLKEEHGCSNDTVLFSKISETDLQKFKKHLRSILSLKEVYV